MPWRAAPARWQPREPSIVQLVSLPGLDGSELSPLDPSKHAIPLGLAAATLSVVSPVRSAGGAGLQPTEMWSMQARFPTVHGEPGMTVVPTVMGSLRASPQQS